MKRSRLGFLVSITAMSAIYGVREFGTASQPNSNAPLPTKAPPSADPPPLLAPPPVARSIIDDTPPIAPPPVGRTLTISGDQWGQFWVSGRADDKAVRWLVDTGAWSVSLNRRTARMLGYNPARLHYDGSVSTVAGNIRTATVRLRSLQLGAFELQDVPAIVLDSDTFDCLLGMSLLRHYRMVAGGDTLTITE